LGGFLGDELFTSRLKVFFYQNRWVKHLLAYLTLIISVVATEHGELPIRKVLLEGLVLYIWFLISTKVPIAYNLAFLSLLLIGFILNQTDDRVYDLYFVRIEKESLLDLFDLSIIAIVVIGFFIYFDEKVIKFGGEFNMSKFLLVGH
jgi:hypothetical protein